MLFKYYDRNLVLKEVKGETHKKRGLWFRPETSDSEMIRDCFKNYNTLLEELTFEDVLLDMGANIGAFAVQAADICKVIAVEPEPYNFEVLESNSPDSINLRGAIVPSDFEEYTVTFELNKSAKNACSGHTLIDQGTRKDRVTFSVPALVFNKLVEFNNVTALKMDIEGAEYGILEHDLPESIRLIGGELHGFKKEHRERMHKEIENLKRQGFEFTFYEEEVVFNKVCLINFTCKR